MVYRPGFCAASQSAARMAPRGEHGTVGGLVADGQALPGPGKQHGMGPDNVAGPHAGNADLAFAALRPGRRGRVSVSALGSRPRALAALSASASAVPDGASTLCLWCASTISMSKSRGRACGGDAHQLLRHRDAQRGVRRDQHRDVARGSRHARFELRAVTRRADHDGHARGARDVERAQREIRTREIDRHLRARQIRRATHPPPALRSARCPRARRCHGPATCCPPTPPPRRSRAARRRPRRHARWPCPCAPWHRSTLLWPCAPFLRSRPALGATVCRSAVSRARLPPHDTHRHPGRGTHRAARHRDSRERIARRRGHRGGIAGPGSCQELRLPAFDSAGTG